jgi:hypothetical protein
VYWWWCWLVDDCDKVDDWKGEMMSEWNEGMMGHEMAKYLSPLSITFWLLYSRANHCIKGYLVAILPSCFISLHLSFLYQ